MRKANYVRYAKGMYFIMRGEIVRFRRKFFGGFNRDDVAAYIAKLAEERNEGLAAAESAQSEIQRLKSEVSRLKKKLGVYEKLIEKMKRRAVGVPRSQPDTAMVAAKPDTLDGTAALKENQPDAQKSVIKIIRKKI